MLRYSLMKPLIGMLIGLLFFAPITHAVDNDLPWAKQVRDQYLIDRKAAIAKTFENAWTLSKVMRDGQVYKIKEVDESGGSRYYTTFGKIQRKQKLMPEVNKTKQGELLIRFSAEVLDAESFDPKRIQGIIQVGLEDVDARFQKWKVHAIEPLILVKKVKRPSNPLFRWYRIHFSQRFPVKLVAVHLKKSTQIEIVGPSYIFSIGSVIPENK